MNKVSMHHTVISYQTGLTQWLTCDSPMALCVFPERVWNSELQHCSQPGPFTPEVQQEQLLRKPCIHRTYLFHNKPCKLGGIGDAAHGRHGSCRQVPPIHDASVHLNVTVYVQDRPTAYTKKKLNSKSENL